MNPLANKDAYKIDHRSQYPQNTDIVYSNFTPRGDKYFPIAKESSYYQGKSVWMGLQRYIKRKLIQQWNTEFFQRPREEVLAEYTMLVNHILGPGAVTFEHIGALHDLGYLPIRVKSLPEGSRVEFGVPVLTVMNTHTDFDWIVNFLETSISQEIWKPTTVATIAYEYKQLLLDYAERTGVDPAFVQFQGHDFSARGATCEEDAANSGIGHLTSFFGTDTCSAILEASRMYNMPLDGGIIGGSLPATEHAVVMLGGKNNELETLHRLITEVYPSGPVAFVGDTWNLWNLITNILPKLKDEIMARDGVLVIRPDSGTPEDIICGTAIRNQKPELNIIEREAEYQGVVQSLWNIFGGTVNDKGYRVLDPHIGAIYGDSITFARAQTILERLEQKGYASSNIVFGIGSFTYQYMTRDTLGSAIKATYGVIDGVGQDMFKDPITDDGTKKSAKGLMRVEKEDGKFVVYDQQSPEQETQGLLQTVFLNGRLTVDISLTDIRNTLNNS